MFCFLHMLIYLMKDKEVFDLNELPLPKYAMCFGLAMGSWIVFLRKYRNS